MNWANALAIAEKGFEAWAAKDHNRKWVRKIDGTPIKNDLLVDIATAFAEAHVQPAPIAGLEPVASLLDELREYTALRYAGDCKCGNCQLVPRATLDRAIQTMAQLEAHAAEQVRAEREACASIADRAMAEFSDLTENVSTDNAIKTATICGVAAREIADAIRARGQV